MNAHMAALREGAQGMDGIRPLERQPLDDVTTVYLDNYQHLVRIAAFMLAEPAAAEDVVQDAYIKVTAGIHRLRDTEKVLAYLRQAVVNGARSRVRRRVVALRHTALPSPDAPGADEHAYAALQQGGDRSPNPPWTGRPGASGRSSAPGDAAANARRKR